jgi:hypothetical protein
MGFGRSCMLERVPTDKSYSSLFIGFKNIVVYIGLFIPIEVKVRAGEIS